jgi:polyisoprenyl-phosphate glycosyltransferase
MISIIIPVLNEENAIASTVAGCKKVIEIAGNSHSEIIVVDDASDDKTPEIAKSSGVKYIRHSENKGYGRSLKDGILVANNDIIIICDADGTYPLEKIPEMLELFGKGNNMVIGQRQWTLFKESFFKKIARNNLKKLAEFTTSKKIQDVNSGLRVFSRKEIIEYLPELCETFSFTTSLTLHYLFNDRSVAYLPVEYRKRSGKTKVRMLKDSLVTIKFIMLALKKYALLRLWVILLLPLFFLGFIAAIFSLLWFPENFPVLMISILFFSLTILLLIVILQKRKS